MTGILGIAGLMGAGKSTAADTLVSAGWDRVKFAGPLKAMIRALYSESGISASEIERKIEGDLKDVPCDILGGKTPRYAMQTLGTEWGRELISPDLWANAAEARALKHMSAGKCVVLDDVRFENEADTIRNLGGLVLEVRRGQRQSGHASESGVAANLIYENTGIVDELRGFMKYVFIDRHGELDD